MVKLYKNNIVVKYHKNTSVTSGYFVTKIKNEIKNLKVKSTLVNAKIVSKCQEQLDSYNSEKKGKSYYRGIVVFSIFVQNKVCDLTAYSLSLIHI